MTKQEHDQIVASIAATMPTDNDGQVAVLLAKLQDDYTGVLNERDSSIATSTDLTEKNERLRAANMEMLLSRGTTPLKPDTAPLLDEHENTPDIDLKALAAEY